MESSNMRMDWYKPHSAMVVEFSKVAGVSPSVAKVALEAYAEQLKTLHDNFLGMYPAIGPFLLRVDNVARRAVTAPREFRQEYRSKPYDDGDPEGRSNRGCPGDS
jgi:hypothetical protein